ncbi:MAG: ATP-binding protein [Bacteroidetes bacterium]|nr:ATP-binding protein [Bacteroidota bacterium]
MHKFIEFRGPAHYFHGRDEIINPFLRALDHYQSCAGGSIFLIKGPPGTGKTALMSELSRHAEGIGYTIAGNITPSALLDPAAMAKRLGVPYTP